MRALLYSHDGLGLGHVRRNLALAHGLREAGDATVLLVTGAEGVDGFDVPPNADLLRLPGIRKVADGQYAARRLLEAQDEVRHLRRTVLSSAVAAFMPDVLVADKHPLGVDGELADALVLQRAAGRCTALGLRDVLDDRSSVRRQWTEQGLWSQVEHMYDEVLVYSRPATLDPLAGVGCPPGVRGRARYCGYVVPPTPDRDRPEDLPDAPSGRLVLATVGGGSDGVPVLRAVVESCRGADWDAVVVVGPEADDADLEDITRRADRAGVEVRASVPELGRWLPHVDAVVSMGGYNTLAESLSAGTPVVCVPRVSPRREQQVRARHFAEAGLLRMMSPIELDPSALAVLVDEALTTSRASLRRRAHDLLGFDGAAVAADHLVELTHQRAPREWRRSA